LEGVESILPGGLLDKRQKLIQGRLLLGLGPKSLEAWEPSLQIIFKQN
jgi:hypothetical protein